MLEAIVIFNSYFIGNMHWSVWQVFLRVKTILWSAYFMISYEYVYQLNNIQIWFSLTLILKLCYLYYVWPFFSINPNELILYGVDILLTSTNIGIWIHYYYFYETFCYTPSNKLKCMVARLINLNWFFFSQHKNINKQ